MDIPTPGTQSSAGSDDFWAFAQISERNPSAAWQILTRQGLMLCVARFWFPKVDFRGPFLGAFFYEHASHELRCCSDEQHGA